MFENTGGQAVSKVEFKNDGPGRKRVLIDKEDIGYLVQQKCNFTDTGTYWHADFSKLTELNFIYGELLEEVKDAVREAVQENL